MRARLVGGPLHGEIFAVGRTIDIIEAHLGDGTLALYRLNAGGAWSYSGMRSMPDSVAARSTGEAAHPAIGGSDAAKIDSTTQSSNTLFADRSDRKAACSPLHQPGNGRRGSFADKAGPNSNHRDIELSFEQDVQARPSTNTRPHR